MVSQKERSKKQEILDSCSYTNMKYVKYNGLARFICENFGIVSNSIPSPFIKLMNFVGGAKTMIDSYFTLKCPHCDYQRTTPIFKINIDSLDERFDFGNMSNSMNIEKLIRQFYFHVETKVRLSGSMKHMEFMYISFGKEYTLKKLKEWARKSIWVSQQINLFIKTSKNKK